MELIKEITEYVVITVEVIGIIIIVGGLLYSLLRYIFSFQFGNEKSYRTLRQEMGKSILLGLEVLVAGDIIETVLVEPTLDRILSLSLIVVVRTILSLSIEYEIYGKVPWGKNSVEDEV